SNSTLAFLGFKSTAMTLASGTKRWNRSNRFADNKLLRKVAPVILPPGRLRLATSPSLTGSLPRLKTIGIDVVACLAASAATGVSAMIQLPVGGPDQPQVSATDHIERSPSGIRSQRFFPRHNQHPAILVLSLLQQQPLPLEILRTKADHW